MKKQHKEVMGEMLAHQESAPVKPKLPITIYGDSTPAALIDGLSENVPNASLSTDEGGIILNGRFAPQTPILNALWGGEDITVNRKSDGSRTIIGPRLTTQIMAQPSVIERFINKTQSDVRGNGYLSRFIVCAPISNCGYRHASGVKYSDDNLKAFNDRVYQLLSESAELDDYTLKRVIRFSEEAKVIWFDVCNDIEFNMGPDGAFHHAKDHASKLPENIARLAALIHCFDSSSEKEMSVATLMESINLMGYFSAQFLNVFCVPPRYITDAQNLMQWLGEYANSGVRYLKRNNILQFGPAGTRKKKDLEAALEHLKPSGNLKEMISRRTRIIDLWPQQPFDEARLNQDLLQDIVF
jgi:hypothetical protein